MELPDEFLARMQGLLGDEFAAFVATFEQPEHRGLRVNTLKLSGEDFSRKRPFALEPVGDFEPAGFRIVDESQPGSHPYHAAGLYYLQEPAAMTVAALMQPQPGEWVLDLAAAPGGKSTHIASLLGDEGLLVANDVDRGRVRFLVENLERWGARNVLITNSAPEQLARAWGALFDRVLLDTPCSGEGMLRRLGKLEWSAAIVAACARRQDLILPAAAALVRPGGTLIYSTCTFSSEENEEVIGRFLNNHADFELLNLPHFDGFARGIGPEFAGTVRLWPHRFKGEGHFVAMMRRNGGTEERRSGGERSPLLLRPSAPLHYWREFADAVLQVDWDEERLGVWNGRLFLLPESTPGTKSVRVVRSGVELGELRKGYFKPGHHLALTLRPEEVGVAVDFALEDERVGLYLAGHDVPVAGLPGWVLVRVNGFGLGWGKGVNGRLKNHYPHHLRRPISGYVP
jgi:16S rRNA C967 or C1407 C5-methylase (RsmB/RsmF family)/NOL1/NOP2/fmu family ribosome biogenesis protein